LIKLTANSTIWRLQLSS